MKLMSEKLPDLQALYVKELRVLLSAEELVIRGLPRMAEMATDEELKQAFRTHELESEQHSARLRTILAHLAVEPDPLKCKSLAAMIDEAEDLIQDTGNEALRDAALIAVAQRIEHYEIASYGAVRHFAHVIGREEEAGLLDQTIQEEGRTDRALTAIAERINPVAQRAA
jgi:ferritin-like metal-binding protein YciE